MVLGKQDLVLKIGNLQTERVVIDVRDCVNAYYKLMLNPDTKGMAFNVCGNDVHKMQHYTDLLIQKSGLLGVEQKIYEPFYRPIDIQVQVGDSSELTEMTGWKPEIPLEQTMEDLLSYWISKLNNGNDIR